MWTLVGLLAVDLAGCNGRSPVEPGQPIPTPTVSPVATPTAVAPPTPTPLPGQAVCCTLADTLPLQLRRGQEFTFAVSMTGNPTIEEWEKGFLVWTFFDGFIADGTFVNFDGDSIGQTPPTAETGAWDVVVSRARFGPGSHLGFTARLRVKPDAHIGYALVGSEATVQNTARDTRSQFQSRRFYVQILE